MCRLASLAVPRDGRAPGLVRDWAERVLQRWELIDPDRDLLLMLNELTTNAIRYAGTPVTVTLAVAEGVIEAGVADPDPAVGQVRSPAPPRDDTFAALPEGGRGLHIVSVLADDWGVTPVRCGKQVWFRQRVPQLWPFITSCVCAGDDLAAARLASGRRAVAVAGPWDVEADGGATFPLG